MATLWLLSSNEVVVYAADLNSSLSCDILSVDFVLCIILTVALASFFAWFIAHHSCSIIIYNVQHNDD